MRKLGVLIHCSPKTDVLAEFSKAKNFGMQTCQLCIWNQATYTDEKAAEINAACEATGLEISTLWAGWSGPKSGTSHTGPPPSGWFPALPHAAACRTAPSLGFCSQN